MKDYSFLVDCMNVALDNGGVVKDVVVGIGGLALVIVVSLALSGRRILIIAIKEVETCLVMYLDIMKDRGPR